MLTRRRFLQAGAALGSLSLTPETWAAGKRPGLAVTAIAPDIWLHTSWKRLESGHDFPSNGLIVSGQDRALIVDTTWPTDQMQPLLKSARNLTGGRPLRLVATHAHEDRMSGLDIARQAGVKSLAHARTQEEARGRGLPPADETWTGVEKRLSLGSRTVRLFRPGPAHTPDNIVVFVEDAGLLFGGCMIRAGATGSLGNTADADIQSWSRSVDAISAKFGGRIRIVVPGHGDPGGPELLSHTRTLAAAAAKDAR